MPKLKDKLPKLRMHKASKQAVVSLGGRTFYCGRWGTAEAQAEYQRLTGLWVSSGGKMPILPGPDTDGLTVSELLAAFWEHAKTHYRKPGGTPTSELQIYQQAMSPVRRLYGPTAASAFGPTALRVVRNAMIQKGWSRRHVNKQVTRIRSVWRWGAGHELVPASVHQTLACVEPLQRGRCEARETEPVRPVPQHLIDAIMPYVSEPVKALIGLQLLTGARAGELVRLRSIDLDTSGNVWVLSPDDHKTAHHGHRRTIYFGPKAQQILRPFMANRPVDSYLFAPSEAEAQRHAEQRAERKTRVQPSQQQRSEASKRRAAKGRRRRAPGDCYGVDSYRRNIHYACDHADAAAKVELAKANKPVPKGRIVPRWGPHRLRHNAATFLRREYGIDIAQTILGHRLGSGITELYAEANTDKARAVIQKVG